MGKSRPVVVHPEKEMPEPPGIQRRHFVDRDGQGIGWAGLIQNAPGDTSGWHHHAANDTHVYVIRGSVTIDFGRGGAESVVARAGDFFIVPSETIHRERTSEDSILEAFVVRVGSEPEEVQAGGPADTELT